MSAIILNSDTARRQEVDRFLGSHVAATKATSILTAFVDLVAWRLDASCASISLIDHNCQHLLATSTTAYHHKVDHPGDDLWHNTWPGRDDASKEDIPCGQTIKISHIHDDRTIFTVRDMSADSRYRRLPLVSGPPFIRFYAGVPIRTSSGIAIGTIFVLDHKARHGITPEHIKFLGETAEKVMETLEIFQCTEELQVNKKMLRGLTALFDSKSVMTGEIALSFRSMGEASLATQHDRSKGRISSHSCHSQSQPPLHRAGAGSKIRVSRSPTEESPSNSKVSMSPPSPRSHLSALALDMDEDLCAEPQEAHHSIQEVKPSNRSLSRSARILHAALQMDHSGGVVFLGGSAELKYTTTNKPVTEGLKTENNKFEQDDHGNTPYIADVLHEPIIIGDSSSSGSYRDDTHSDQSTSSQDFEETMILGSCTAVADTDEDGQNLSFLPLLIEELDRLIIAYPEGSLWSVDVAHNASSTAQESRPINAKAAAVEVTQGKDTELVIPSVPDAVLLANRFPGARQVMFVPLEEVALDSATSGCFIWSTSEDTRWSRDLELSFCTTFCACIMAKMARIDVVAAERRRNAFVSSISHELRSPLHGILASADLLGETRCDVFQKSLVDTVDSCGRTLLDTINHVLDFSKMSSFGNNGSELRGQSYTRSTTLDKDENASSDFRGGGLLTIAAETNVAAICEEVIEGLVVGQHLREVPSFPSSISSNNSTIKSPRTGDGDGDRIFLSNESRRTGTNSSKVEILLDIQKKDWWFVTQPGALRRITMNIFGNAIKYTEKGCIRVELQAQDVAKNSRSKEIGHSNADACIVVLTVTDTGKGISKAFLRDHLYSAFAQEDNLSAGTGLGLSLVRSIVSMLRGTIDIQSEEGKGTIVTVRLPMRRKSQVAASQASPDPGVSIRPRETDPIVVLRGLARGKTIALFGFDSIKGENSTSKSVGETLAYYVTEWYDLTETSPWSSSSQSDILIADEVDLPALLAHGPKFPGSLAGPLLVILCSDAVKYGQTTVYAAGGGIIEFVTKPLGPYKLAKALYRCLQRAVNVETAAPKVAPTSASTKIWKGPQKVSNTALPQLQIAKSSLESGVSNPIVPIGISYGSNSQGLDEDTAQLVPVSASKLRNSAPLVLLVDDNAINLNLLEIFVKRCQCGRIDTATNGQLAVQAVKQSGGYDLIFMDLSMPVLNGFEATRLIRTIESNRAKTSGESAPIPMRSVIIALTGLASVRDRTEAYAAGVDLYLTKPVSLRDLKELLNRWNLHGPESFLSTEGNKARVNTPKFVARE